MSENIAVHSDEHLKYLLEQNASDVESNEVEVEDHGRTPNNIFQQNGKAPEPSKNIDVLKMGEGSDIDWEWHDESCKGNNIRFINQLESQRAHAMEEVANEMTENEEGFDNNNQDYSELHAGQLEHKIDYNRFDSSKFLDSLDMSDVDHGFRPYENSIDGNSKRNIGLSDRGDSIKQIILDNVETNQFDDAGGNEKEKNKRQAKLDLDTAMIKSRRLKAGFKYKEPDPKFIVRNKIELGKRIQGSYSQKFLERKTDCISNVYEKLPSKKESIHAKNSDRNDKSPISYDPYKREMQENQHVHLDYDGLVTDSVHTIRGIGDGDLPVEILRHHGTNIEFPMLDKMIREEEETLKNQVFDISLPEMINSYSAEKAQYDLEGLSQTQDKKSTRSFSQVPKKEENAKHQSYAQLHSFAPDKYNKQVELPSSYVGQHLEKKNKHTSYKRYSLKDYTELNKEIILQRSLGPDISSEEYLQKVIICSLYH